MEQERFEDSQQETAGDYPSSWKSLTPILFALSGFVILLVYTVVNQWPFVNFFYSFAALATMYSFIHTVLQRSEFGRVIELLSLFVNHWATLCMFAIPLTLLVDAFSPTKFLIPSEKLPDSVFFSYVEIIAAGIFIIYGLYILKKIYDCKSLEGKFSIIKDISDEVDHYFEFEPGERERNTSDILDTLLGACVKLVQMRIGRRFALLWRKEICNAWILLPDNKNQDFGICHSSLQPDLRNDVCKLLEAVTANHRPVMFDFQWFEETVQTMKKTARKRWRTQFLRHPDRNNKISAVGWVYKTGVVKCAEDLDNCLAFDHSYIPEEDPESNDLDKKIQKLIRIKSMTAMPISIDGNVGGVLMISKNLKNAFLRSDIETIQIVCKMIGRVLSDTPEKGEKAVLHGKAG